VDHNRQLRRSIKNKFTYKSFFQKTIKPFITLARPSHYIKNGFVLVPLFFAHRFTDMQSLGLVFLGLVGFCMAASGVYVLNDIVDREKDAGHRIKRARPIAAGEISVARAIAYCLFWCVLAGGACLLVSRTAYSMVILLYMILNLLYSFQLQKIAGLNTACVATGFVLRVFAGAVVIDVPVSYWLAGLTLLLALFLAFSKRRCEVMAADNASEGDQRPLASIGVILLAGACLTGYVAYTLSPAVIQEHAAPDLYLTSIWVALGIFRYLKVGFSPNGDCSPVFVFLKDRLLQLFVLLWVGTLWWVIYMNGG